MKRNDNAQLRLAYLNLLSDIPKYQIMMGVAAFIILLQLVAIVIILPLKETKVQYVAFSDSANVSFRVIPTPLTKDQKVLLLRQALREYVTNRSAIDFATEAHRFRRVVAMSNNDVEEELRDDWKRIEKDASFSRRDVKIISDIPIGRGVHQVEFKTTDKFQEQKYENSWVVTISYKFMKQVVKEDNELLNPLGIVVTKYYQAKKQIDEEKLNEIFKK
jgi:type IV secretory pathway component VirB8